MQLVDPMATAMVRSQHAWIKYNEPEGHLDALAAHLARLIDVDSKIMGLTYKDDSTLARLNQLGYKKTSRYDMKSDLGIIEPCAGLETIQAAMEETMADRLAAKYGEVDLLIVRHVLEHAHAPARFLQALGKLLAPGGRLVFEVPDSRKFVDACDYSFIWEEHISYFTPRTLKSFARHNGFGTFDALIYPYPLEDSLVTILQKATGSGAKADCSALSCDLESERRFAQKFAPICMRYHNHFELLRKASKRIAVFGAGHLAAKFLNFFGLKDVVDYVIDDDSNKQGLAMPGSGVPIVNSSHLQEIDLCLLALSPESEQKVLGKQQAYMQKGGNFQSIFALSPLAIKFP